MEFIFGRYRGTIGKITNAVLAWFYETYAKLKVLELDHKVFDYYRLHDYRTTMKQRGPSPTWLDSSMATCTRPMLHPLRTKGP